MLGQLPIESLIHFLLVHFRGEDGNHNKGYAHQAKETCQY
jgi:hypothetical protein